MKAEATSSWGRTVSPSDTTGCQPAAPICLSACPSSQGCGRPAIHAPRREDACSCSAQPLGQASRALGHRVQGTGPGNPGHRGAPKPCSSCRGAVPPSTKPMLGIGSLKHPGYLFLDQNSQRKDHFRADEVEGELPRGHGANQEVERHAERDAWQARAPGVWPPVPRRAPWRASTPQPSWQCRRGPGCEKGKLTGCVSAPDQVTGPLGQAAAPFSGGRGTDPCWPANLGDGEFLVMVLVLCRSWMTPFYLDPPSDCPCSLGRCLASLPTPQMTPRVRGQAHGWDSNLGLANSEAELGTLRCPPADGEPEAGPSHWPSSPVPALLGHSRCKQTTWVGGQGDDRKGPLHGRFSPPPSPPPALPSPLGRPLTWGRAGQRRGPGNMPLPCAGRWGCAEPAAPASAHPLLMAPQVGRGL